MPKSRFGGLSALKNLSKRSTSGDIKSHSGMYNSAGFPSLRSISRRGFGAGFSGRRLGQEDEERKKMDFLVSPEGDVALVLKVLDSPPIVDPRRSVRPDKNNRGRGSQQSSLSPNSSMPRHRRNSSLEAISAIALKKFASEGGARELRQDVHAQLKKQFASQDGSMPELALGGSQNDLSMGGGGGSQTSFLSQQDYLFGDDKIKNENAALKRRLESMAWKISELERRLQENPTMMNEGVVFGTPKSVSRGPGAILYSQGFNTTPVTMGSPSGTPGSGSPAMPRAGLKSIKSESQLLSGSKRGGGRLGSKRSSEG